jgi:predicted Zn-dependent peptidase
MTRLGKATVTDMPLLDVEKIVARIDAVTSSDVAELAASVFDAGRLSAAGIGPDEDRFRAAVEQVNPSLLVAAA